MGVLFDSWLQQTLVQAGGKAKHLEPLDAHFENSSMLRSKIRSEESFDW